MENLLQNNIKFQELVQNRLNVSIIMTPRNDLKTCKLSEKICYLIENNFENFSFLPVVDNLENIIGVLNLKNKNLASNNLVKDFYEPIKPEMTVDEIFNRLMKVFKEKGIKVYPDKTPNKGAE